MNRLSMTLTSALACAAATVLQAGPAADRYGQCTGEEWPGKIASDDQFRADAAKEWALIKDAKRDPAKFDRYGGAIEAKAYRATGFFRLEKIAGRWWFITPEGHRFFLIGLDAVGWNEGGYGTPLTENGRPRPEFGPLPDREKYPEAYLRSGRVNFLGANLKIKYGPEFERKLDDVLRRRLLAWGFNSTAKWGWGKKLDGIPYFEDADIKGAIKYDKKFRWIDMYDPEFAAKADAAAREVCARRKGDPDLIAYACENENGWSWNGIRFMLGETNPDLCAKRAFLDFLAKKHGGDPRKVAKLAGKPGATAAELMATPLTVEMFPKAEVAEFIVESSRLYHRTVRDAFRKYDPDHLFMGASHCVYQSGEWIRGAAETLDFIGVHSYALTLSWFEQYLPMMAELDKPFAVLEYSFVQQRRGLRGYGPTNTMNSEQARGLGYRLFTERIAPDPRCLGFGYFICWDQPVTQRSIGGEAHNFGLFNQQDQPYYEMLAEVGRANSKLFELHDGKGTPFTLKSPRTLLGTPRTQKLIERFLPGTMSDAVVPDINAPDYFSGADGRLKVDEMTIKTPGTYYAGVLASGGGKPFTGFRLTVYLWKKAPDQNLEHYFTLEKSGDGKTFTPVKFKAAPGARSEFNAFTLTPAEPLGNNAKFLRIGYLVRDTAKSWAAQIADLSVEQ